jgi:hypothetical protein
MGIHHRLIVSYILQDFVPNCIYIPYHVSLRPLTRHSPNSTQKKVAPTMSTME